MIGKSKRPHSFPKYTLDLAQHVTYRHNAKAWMTGEIFVEFLNKLNNKMKLQDRNILLFGIYNFNASPPYSQEPTQYNLQENDPEFDKYFE